MAAIGSKGPKIIIASGAQEIGKTYLSLKDFLFLAYFAKHRQKTLLFDTNGEFAAYKIDKVTHRIPRINDNEIIKYSNLPVNEVKRICPIPKNGGAMDEEYAEKLILKTINEFRNGNLLIEDTSKIWGDHLPDNVGSALCNTRHRGVNLTLHLQSIDAILPKMWRNVKLVRYHYQLDDVSNSAGKMSKGELELFSIVEKMVNKQFLGGNRYFYVWVWRELKKIRGEFSPRMLSDAIKEYISENPKSISHLEKQRDLVSGKKVNSYGQAVELKTRELFIKYNGN